MKILIVEDEYSLADMLRELLEKEKFIVDVALNGEEGLYKAQVEIYDIIVMDVMLPKLNGFDVLKEIRKKNNDVSVLMLTAKSELDDKIYGLDSGADDYMTKPFEMKEFLARIRALMRRKLNLDSENLCYKDLKLEPNQFKLQCINNKQNITLGSKEYLIMEYLILNSKQIISKEQISNKIWGFENDVEYNNVEVYISFLRKKIQFLKSNVKIKTVRGIGYCLEGDIS